MGKVRDDLELMLDSVRMIDLVNVHYTTASGWRMSNRALALATYM
jgi:hypothetical protein